MWKWSSLKQCERFSRLEHLGGGQQLGRAQAELGVFAAALGPLAHAFAEQARANADQRLDADLP